MTKNAMSSKNGEHKINGHMSGRIIVLHIVLNLALVSGQMDQMLVVTLKNALVKYDHNLKFENLRINIFPIFLVSNPPVTLAVLNNYPLSSSADCIVNITFDPTPTYSYYKHMYIEPGCMPAVATIKPQTTVLLMVPTGCVPQK